MSARGSQVLALEKNVFQYRAIEMVLALFYCESLKSFLVGSVETSEDFDRRLGEATAPAVPAKKKWQHTLDRLEHDAILSKDERAELEGLVDYRNDIAHRVHHLTQDVAPVRDWGPAEIAYNPKARKRLKYYREELPKRMASRYIMMLSLRGVMFEAAERAYLASLRSLRARIAKQLKKRRREWDGIRAEAQLSPEERAKFDATDPFYVGENGRLTAKGIEAFNFLIASGRSPLAVAAMMRLSLRTVRARKKKLEAKKATSSALRRR